MPQSDMHHARTRSTPALVRMVRLYCPRCDTEMHFREHEPLLTEAPPQYPHECPKCKYREYLPRTYPRVEYDEAGKPAAVPDA